MFTINSSKSNWTHSTSRHHQIDPRFEPKLLHKHDLNPHTSNPRQKILRLYYYTFARKTTCKKQSFSSLIKQLLPLISYHYYSEDAHPFLNELVTPHTNPSFDIAVLLNNRPSPKVGVFRRFPTLDFALPKLNGTFLLNKGLSQPYYWLKMTALKSTF